MKSLQAMKILMIVATIFVSFKSIAQVEDTQTIQLTANLQTSMQLTLGASQVEFNFTTVDDYNNGIGASGSIFHSASVNSTANWELEIQADGNLTHTDNSSTIDLNQVGISASLEGNYGSQQIASSTSLTNPLVLSSSKQVILTMGSQTNAGTATDNAFNIYWQMGTKQGNMNNETILEKDYKRGTYTTNVDFILSEII